MRMNYAILSAACFVLSLAIAAIVLLYNAIMLPEHNNAVLSTFGSIVSMLLFGGYLYFEKKGTR